MADIFLSYSREDRAFIERLAERLTAEGWSVFWDLNIPTGKKWDDVLQRELDSARAVVVAWSASSIQSSWVKEEAAHGRERNILFPIIIDDIQAPFGFSFIQAENLSAWDGAADSPHISRLLNALHTLLDAGPTQQSRLVTLQNHQPARRPASPTTRDKIPLSSDELIDRLTRSVHWDASQLDDARIFFEALGEIRRRLGAEAVGEARALYHPFDPDALVGGGQQPGSHETAQAVAQTTASIASLLRQAKYEKVAHEILEHDLQRQNSDLQIQIDFADFEQLALYYKGTGTLHQEHRPAYRFFRKTPIEVPTFKRLVFLFKPATPLADGDDSSNDFIYLKMFKDVARADIEMIFPNAKLRTSFKSKLKIGLTAIAGISFVFITTAGKIALFTSNPIGAVGAIVGLTAAFARALMTSNQAAQRYTTKMMKLLYWNAMAANADVLTSVQDRAVEETITEDVLLYFLLLKQPIQAGDLHKLVEASERYLLLEYGITMPLDFEASLQRLVDYGVVTPINGTLQTLSPSAAATAHAAWSRDRGYPVSIPDA